jgi:hypothetical protein
MCAISDEEKKFYNIDALVGEYSSKFLKEININSRKD